jgi:hypothetical protein
LSSLEKTKRKGNRNSEIKRKTKEAQLLPPSRSRCRVGPLVSVVVRPCVSLLSLYLRACPANRSHAPIPHARSQCAVGPAHQLCPLPCNRAPLLRVPSRTRPRPRIHQPPPACLTPIPPPALPHLLGHLICRPRPAHPLLPAHARAPPRLCRAGDRDRAAPVPWFRLIRCCRCVRARNPLRSRAPPRLSST